MGGAEQFQVDVDLDSLRAAHNGLQMLSEHLATVATVTSRVPNDVGKGWTGPAATTMKAELSGLGAQSTSFSPKFHEAATALKAFADAAETFQTQTLPQYIRQWDMAEANAKAAYDKAERRYDSEIRATGSLRDPDASVLAQATARASRGSARGQVATGQRYAMQAMDSQFTELKAELGRKAKAAGDAMAGLTVVAVPDSVAKNFIGHRGDGQTFGWCDPDGSTFPPDLGISGRLPGMTLVKDMHDMAKGQEAAQAFNQTFATGPRSKAELDAFTKKLNGDSEAFRQSFLASMDPKLLQFMQVAARTGVDADTGMKYGEVVTAISIILAKASDERSQGRYPVQSGFYEGLRNQYKSAVPPEVGYLLLAEIVQAGQAEQDTWNSALLTDITRDTMAFERELIKTNPTFFWGDAFRNNNGVLPTQAGRSLTGAVAGRVDAVGMLFDALGHNADASQDVLRGPNGNADLNLLHHLYNGRNGAVSDMSVWGPVLGNVLQQASTHHRGSGGPGSRDYVSAEIASDLVNYVGEQPDERLLPGMQENVLNILTAHMDAVNHFTANEVGSDGPVRVGDPDFPQPWFRNTHAVFDSSRLDTLMTAVFASDYWTAQIEEEARSGKNPHPLLSQFTLAQQATWQQDITYAASHLRNVPGLIEELAGLHGSSSNATIRSYTEGIVGEGGRQDAAQASSREAMDFILGLGLDKVAEKVPGGPGLGVPKLIAGQGLDTLKGWAIDNWLPEGDAVARMKEVGADLSTTNFDSGSLPYLKWLDQAGQGPTGDAAYDSWARAQPANRDFMTLGADGHWHIADPGKLYHGKDAPGGQKAWEDYVKYVQSVGRPWLRDQDIYDAFTTGTGAKR